MWLLALAILSINPFSKVLNIDDKGRPLVRIGLATGVGEVLVSGSGLVLRDPDGSMKVAGAGEWKVRLVSSEPGTARWWVGVSYTDRDQVDGYVVNERGFVMNLGGMMLDLRRRIVSLGPYSSRREALRVLGQQKKLNEYAFLYSDVVQRPEGIFEARSSSSTVRGRALAFTALRGVTVKGKGFSGTYPGTVYVLLDIRGRLVVVNELPLETYVRGILPGELFPSAPMEALKAQAIAARGQVLSKIGARHLGDPYHLCASVHCQVYKGLASVHSRTSSAVKKTTGLVLVDSHGHPVDTVYSAACGGHTEAAHRVWDGPVVPYLTGRFDLTGRRPALNLTRERDIRTFIMSPRYRGACSRKGVYRWTVRIPLSFMDALVRKLGAGRKFRRMRVLSRGNSGRIMELLITGDGGDTVLHGELTIRRRLGGLKSSMFVWDRTRDALILHGGGYGHGVGMCQWGAIGRARAGWDYRRILKFYYPGSRLVRIY